MKSTLAVTPVTGVGTLLFDVSVNPGNGKVYVANTDARNLVRFGWSILSTSGLSTGRVGGVLEYAVCD